MPVPPGTSAKISCRDSYRQDTTVLGLQRDIVRCNAKGQWEPKPINCIPGSIAINLYINGTLIRLENDGKNNFNSVSNIITLLRDRVIIQTDIKLND